MVKKAIESEDRRPSQKVTDEFKYDISKDNKQKLHGYIEYRQNPVRILAKIIMKAEPSNIMFEATKAIRNLSRTEEVCQMLMVDNELLTIYKNKI